MIYADPSFLVSLYAWDGNTAVAKKTYESDARRPLILTPWQRFEVRNAIRLVSHKLRRSGVPVPFQIGNALKEMEHDLADGILRHRDTDLFETLHLSEELSARHTEGLGVAAVDIWHVAAAILLQADAFWTFDIDQYGLAKAIGKFKHLPRLATG